MCIRGLVVVRKEKKGRRRRRLYGSEPLVVVGIDSTCQVSGPPVGREEGERQENLRLQER